ncbi:MAG: hypothetical protein EXR75_09520 [Myxococcales bacterium]|nr:hypothetical protein [Myxococcales bacterium]
MLADGASCRKLGELEGDDVLAAQHLDSACRHGDALGCRRYAERHFRGRGTVHDNAYARERLLRGCMLDDDSDAGESCRELAGNAALFVGKLDTPSRDTLLDRGCTKGDIASCRMLASEHYGNGRFELAIGPAGRLSALEPNQWTGPYLRGISLYNLGRFDAATGDLERLCELRRGWPYCHFWLFLARERTARNGTPELLRASAAKDPLAWPRPVFGMLLGQLRDAEFLRRARHADRKLELQQLCEAHYYLGARHLLAGQTKEATEHFESTLATGVTNFVEYGAATAELERLRAAQAPSR